MSLLVSVLQEPIEALKDQQKPIKLSETTLIFLAPLQGSPRHQVPLKKLYITKREKWQRTAGSLKNCLVDQGLIGSPKGVEPATLANWSTPFLKKPH